MKVESLKIHPDMEVVYDSEDYPMAFVLGPHMIVDGERIDRPGKKVVSIPFPIMKHLVANWIRKEFHHQIDHTDDDTFLIEGPQASDF